MIHANSGLVSDAGPLSGITQTAPRAELVAMLCALKWTLQTGQDVVAWCDAAHVVDGVQALLTGGTVEANRHNADLWCEILSGLQQLPADGFSGRHVPSHLDISRCDGPYEEWLAKFNSQADTAAVVANQNRDQAFRELHQRANRRHVNQQALTTRTSPHLL